MAPLTGAQISIDRWSKLLLIGCVLLIVVSSHAFFGCGRPHGHHNHHGPHGFPGDQHPDPAHQQQEQPDLAAVSIAIGDNNNAHASHASFSFSHSHNEQQQQPQQQGATFEGRGRGFMPHHRGARHHGRRHHSHSHEQPEQQPEEQRELPEEVAVNAGTFDIKIHPARVAGIKMPEAPRAVAIPLDVPQADVAASAVEKPEPRPRGRHSERRIHPRRAFRPDRKSEQAEPQQQEPQQQQPEGEMEQFPVIVDGLQQPLVDPIPPVFNQQQQEQPQVRPMPLIYIANDGNNQQVHPHPQPHGHGFGGKKGRCCCAQRRLAGLGLATGATGVIAAFRPSRCGVALFLIGVLVVEVLTLLRVSSHVIRNVDQCMNAARNVDEISACGDFGRRAGITATLIIGVLAASFATCGARLGRGVVARELEERVEEEAAAVSGAILAGSAVPIVVGSCDLAPLPAYVLAVEGTACVDAAEQQQEGACSV